MSPLFVPSKTFFVGEYTALVGGPSLVACTTPCFRVDIEKSAKQDIFPLHLKSASFQFLQSHQLAFEKIKINLVDPHRGSGGLGASGAQFIALYWQALSLSSSLRANAFAVRDALLDCSQGSSLLPSGYDVVAQMTGGLAQVNAQESLAVSHPWFFSEIEFAIVRTGFKVNTHEHLTSKLSFDPEKLRLLAENSVKLYLEKKDSFFESLNVYYRELVDQNLILTDSSLLLEEVKSKYPGFLTAKTCGAAGADTLLFCYPRQDRDIVLSCFQQRNLDVVYAGQELAKGCRSVFQNSDCEGV